MTVVDRKGRPVSFAVCWCGKGLANGGEVALHAEKKRHEGFLHWLGWFLCRVCLARPADRQGDLCPRCGGMPYGSK